jgi:hypothetical protein
MRPASDIRGAPARGEFWPVVTLAGLPAAVQAAPSFTHVCPEATSRDSVLPATTGTPVSCHSPSRPLPVGRASTDRVPAKQPGSAAVVKRHQPPSASAVPAAFTARICHSYVVSAGNGPARTRRALPAVTRRVQRAVDTVLVASDTAAGPPGQFDHAADAGRPVRLSQLREVPRQSDVCERGRKGTTSSIRIDHCDERGSGWSRGRSGRDGHRVDNEDVGCRQAAEPYGGSATKVRAGDRDWRSAGGRPARRQHGRDCRRRGDVARRDDESGGHRYRNRRLRSVPHSVPAPFAQPVVTHLLGSSQRHARSQREGSVKRRRTEAGA